MTTLRLLADDLTGALDAAAEFVGLTGQVQTVWQGGPEAALAPSAALDTGTREAEMAVACATALRCAGVLGGADIAFKKIDSLMRGHALPELAACVATGAWRHTVLAPAFPFYGRITRAGQQWQAVGADWVPVGPNLVQALRALGVSAGAGPSLQPGITVFDAETDAELDQAVAAAAQAGPVLWCGTGGLARALAAHAPPPAMPPIPGPVLGLFGSDNAATAAQLAACGLHWTALPHGGPDSAAALALRLRCDGVALASLDLPTGLPREAAADRIGRELRALVTRLPPPGTLLVAGGETLRSLCQALGAASLLVAGRVVPGVPVSRLCGGAWDGVTVVSKSGAFGHPGLLRELLRLPHPERTTA